MEVNTNTDDSLSDSFEYIDISDVLDMKKEDEGKKEISFEYVCTCCKCADFICMICKEGKLPCKGTCPCCIANKREEISAVKQSGGENTSKTSEGTSKDLRSPLRQISSENRIAELDEEKEMSDDGFEIISKEILSEVVNNACSITVEENSSKNTSAVKQSGTENTSKTSEGKSKDLKSPRLQIGSENWIEELDEAMAVPCKKLTFATNTTMRESSDDGIEVLYEESAMPHERTTFESSSMTRKIAINPCSITVEKSASKETSAVKQSGAENTSETSEGTSKDLKSPRRQISSENRIAELNEALEKSMMDFLLYVKNRKDYRKS